MSEFYLDKIETRSPTVKGVKKYIIKGYATVPNYVYTHTKEKDTDGKVRKTFKEYFTDEAVENIKRKAKSQHIFADYGHQKIFGETLQNNFEQIETRSGLDLTEEKAYLKEALRYADIPMFKFEDMIIDENGLFVEIHGNPFYRDVDEDHKKRFDATWSSLENGYINGISFNMKPTDTVEINSELTQINDADVYGISLLSGAACDMAPITEVAIRCIRDVRGERICQMKRKMTSLMM